jgi:hypothetical protein
MSTRLFCLSGMVGGPTSSNNVLDRNNYDEGGTDFVAQPPTAAHEFAAGDPLDVVDATAWLDRAEGEVVNLYFSASPDSPSLLTLPYWAGPSGANIFFNICPPMYTPTTLYAAYEQLQLDPNDNIDAMIVFDRNNAGEFDEMDQVLFSLAPGSPSLDTIPGTGADVFTVTYGEAPALFVAAADLGLGHPDDDINALDFLLCDKPVVCAAQHGIRGMRGDLDGDCDVDTSDLGQLLAAYGTCEGSPEFDPVADLDGDGCVRLADLGVVLAAYGKTCD